MATEAVIMVLRLFARSTDYVMHPRKKSEAGWIYAYRMGTYTFHFLCFDAEPVSMILDLADVAAATCALCLMRQLDLLVSVCRASSPLRKIRMMKWLYLFTWWEFLRHRERVWKIFCTIDSKVGVLRNDLGMRFSSSNLRHLSPRGSFWSTRTPVLLGGEDLSRSRALDMRHRRHGTPKKFPEADLNT